MFPKLRKLFKKDELETGGEELEAAKDKKTKKLVKFSQTGTYASGVSVNAAGSVDTAAGFGSRQSSRLLLPLSQASFEPSSKLRIESALLSASFARRSYSFWRFGALP